MNSYFSTLQGSLLEMLSDILDMADQLHTVSIEYTLLRDKGLPVGFTITLQCLLAEQKPMEIDKTMWGCHVCGYFNYNDQHLCARCGTERKVTVSANC